MKRRAAGHRARPSPKRPGRPSIHDETWTKVTVILFERQVHALDTLADTMRGRGNRSINRASLIRALIDGMLHSPLDVSDLGSEADLRNAIAHRMSKEPRSL